MMRDLMGQQLGNYRLVKLLGRGGFAEVYLGQHVQIDSQQAAIKVLYLAGVDTHKFRQEAQTIASLKHPNIIRLFDFSDQQHMPYLVMDYAPNGSLGTRHPAGEKVPLATVVQYVTQIASALQYAHDLHIIHRDIKPDNVLLGSHGELLLSDFGIAVLSKTGRVTLNAPAGTAGTPYYMAPEMFKGKPDKASDQYALAVMVYHWLSGTLPFSEGDFIQLGYQHAYEPVPPLRERTPLVSAGVETVVMKALAKDLHQRFATVQAFATALEQASWLGLNQPPMPPRNAITLSQLHSPSVLITPPNQSPQQGINALPPSYPSHVLTPHLRKRSSRRKVIVGLVGLTLMGSGIIWFTASHGPTPSLNPSPTSTPLSLGITLHMYKGHHIIVSSVAWSPDGKRIASGSGDKTVQVWDAATGNTIYTYQYSDAITSVAWSPDGKLIASSSGGAVQVWDAVDRNNISTYTGHSNTVNSVAWSPDGKLIASGSLDKTVQVWNPTNGNNVYTYQRHTTAVHSVAWSPDSKLIASGSGGAVQVWNPTDGNNIYTYKGQVSSVAWSPNGKHIAIGTYDKKVWVLNPTNSSNVYPYTGHHDVVESVAWSPDGKHIASGSLDKTVQVWNAIDSSNVYTYTGHHDKVCSVAWSPDGKLIASGSLDKTVQVWVAS